MFGLPYILGLQLNISYLVGSVLPSNVPSLPNFVQCGFLASHQYIDDILQYNVMS